MATMRDVSGFDGDDDVSREDGKLVRSCESTAQKDDGETGMGR